MPKELNREKILETLGVLALACLIIGHLVKNRGFVAAAVLFLVVGLFVKPVARWIATAWLKFAEILGAVNSRILLGLIFYLFLTPIAFLTRLFRGDFLHLKKQTGVGRTYWRTRDHSFTAADIDKLW